MSDVRPELQQIREALAKGKATRALAARDWENERGWWDERFAALARVEATLNEALGIREGYVYRTEAIISERRAVAAEAERDEWKAKYQEENRAAWTLASELSEAEHRAKALTDALEVIAKGRWEINFSARKYAADALAAGSATGASGAPQDPARPAPAEPPREPRRCDKSFGDLCLLPHGHTGDHVTAAGARWYALDATPAAPAEPPREEVSEPGATAPRGAGNGLAEAAVEGSHPSRPGSLTSPAPAEPPPKLHCDVCGRQPWWIFPREGDPCFKDDGGHLTYPAPAEPPREDGQ